MDLKGKVNLLGEGGLTRSRKPKRQPVASFDGLPEETRPPRYSQDGSPPNTIILTPALGEYVYDAVLW